ncbi:MAG: hypothetical protein C0509_06760 [Acinetobacter sp.]|nr:hypothetical protein [Acinetobacter sp.]
MDKIAKQRRDAYLTLIKEQGPQSFTAALDAYFPAPHTQKRILAGFERLGLPLPKNSDQFMAGTDGILIFTNVYGLVIRIEFAEKKSRAPQPVGAAATGYF